MSTRPIKVLYIGGSGRSGSTLLDNILGQIDGFFSVGELQYIWDRSLQDDRLCSCGETFHNCSLWSQVVARALDDFHPQQIPAMVEARESLTPRKVISACYSRRNPFSEKDFADYARRNAALLESISEATGGRVIVDSSKSPGHALLLSHLPGVQLHLLHLIRDPRAVAYSWQKKKVYDDSGDEVMYMTRHSPARSSKIWITWNLATEIVAQRRRLPYLRLRYEDFIAAPRQALEEILALLGEESDKLPVSGERQVEMGPLHALAGNPSRFQKGPVELRRDDAWRERQNPGHRRLVTALTWPLLWRYGYLS